MRVEAELGVAIREGRNQDVDLAVIEQIFLQVGRHHFHFVLRANAYGIDDGVEVARDGDGVGCALEEVLTKLVPEGVETEFGSGLAPRILDDVGRVEGDAFLLPVLFHEGGLLFRCLYPTWVTEGLLLEMQPGVDVLFKESMTTLSGWKVPHFMHANNFVPLFNRFNQFGGAPPTGEKTISITVTTLMATFQQGFGHLLFHASTTQGKGELQQLR